MAKAKNKTVPTRFTAEEYLANIEAEARRNDCQKILDMMQVPGYQDFADELSRLGKHKIGKACLYIKRLSDVDEGVLKEIMQKGVDQMAEKYPL